ncbi:MAG: leucyl aminopeptidase [Candidatus Abawacabacteria bacterium]|nr:leucyl aminopeptidase [Candidatus Abawacabacteria bacterium]
MVQIHHAPTLKAQGSIVVPLFQDEVKNIKTGNKTLDQYIKNRLAAKDFEAKLHEVFSSHIDQGDKSLTLLLVGLGKKSDCNEEMIRETGGHVCKRLRGLKRIEAQISSTLTDNQLFAFLEGVALANYRVDQFKTDKEPALVLLKSLSIIHTSKNKSWQKELGERLKIVSHVHQVRDLVNTPADNIYPESLAQKAKDISKKYRLKVTILGEKEIVKQKLGLLWAVGKGSVHKPRLITLAYNGGNKNQKPVLLVGKGITFDSGGYNLKPTNFIEDMYMDMAGGATVLGIISACSELKLPINVIAIVAAAENLVSSSAYKPSDIIRAYNGKTVEITNTDAEGRLVLADAISYGIKNFKPRAIIDLATLTGACMVALGDRYSGVFSNNNDLLKALKQAADNTSELVWELPIHPDYEKRLKSEKADMVNCDIKTRMAGASTAAAFLKKFTEEIPWAHLDIAGTAFGNMPRAHDCGGSSGFGLRLVVNYLSNLAKNV